MNALKTTRAVLIEDDDEEAAPLIMALARMGIGTWHITGAVEQELTGGSLGCVRLVFLDLRLTSMGPSTTPKQAMSAALSILREVVNNSRWSVGLVYWTKHEEDITDFETLLKASLPDFRPAFVLRISNKKELLEHGGMQSLMDTLQNVMEERSAYHLLADWEHSVFAAASATTELLAHATEGEGSDAYSNLLDLLAALSVATGGDTATDHQHAVANLFEGLNPIHFDQVEQRTRRSGDENPHAAELISAMQRSSHLTEYQRARLNGILLVSELVSNEPSFQPGSVFLPDETLGNRCPHHRFALDCSSLTSSMLQFTGDKEYKTHYDRLNHRTKKTQEDARVAAQHRASEITEACKAILVEISAACDFVQGKRDTARFIGGLLVPNEHKALVKKADFIRRLKEIIVPGLEGIWIPLLNSRYVFGLVIGENQLADSKAVFRFRTPVLVDIQAWVASQSARPGHLSV